MAVDALEIVSSTVEAAFGTDEQGRIVIWNRLAERLLGYHAAEVLGKPCQQIVCGRDVFGNRFCDERCALYKMVARQEPISRFDLDVHGASGQLRRVEMTIIVVPGPKPSQFTIIHFARPIEQAQKAARYAPETLPVWSLPQEETAIPSPLAASYVLTDREVDALRLVAEGLSSQTIADALFISVTTVRNHIQNILRKLEVHSKLEAVALALRLRLI